MKLAAQERPSALLDQWRMIADRFPRVAMMARDILAIQAAGVGIEREFSIARSFNQDNKTYSPAVLSALMICNHHQSEEVREAKRDYYIRLREEEITDEELVAELEQDVRATEELLKGLTIIYVSDNDERDGDDVDDDDEDDSDHEEVAQIIEHVQRSQPRVQKRARISTITGRTAKSARGGARICK
jgi:hypothetical protein